MEKSAKELFEDLGYNYYYEKGWGVKIKREYYIDNEDGEIYSFDYIEEITFLEDNEYSDSGIHLDKIRRCTLENNWEQIPFIISKELWKAIDKQMEEGY